MKHTLAGLILAVAATGAHAGQLDINLSDDTLKGAFAGDLPSETMGGQYDLGVLVGEKSSLEFQQVHAGLLVTGDAGARDATVTAGLGGRVFLLSGDGADGGGLALGGMVDARLPSFNRIGMIAYLYGAPEASTFGDLDGWYEYAVSLDYQVLQAASVYLGYRQVKVDVEGAGTYTVDTGFHLGLRLKF